MSGALDAALALARLGWPAFPVEPGGKDPVGRLVPNGVKNATTDPNRIRRWWAKQPDANIGLACGPPGPVVLDIDDPEHPEGREYAERLAAAPQVATNRGRHFYLSGRCANKTGLVYGELRSTGLYVLAPPSIHPSGREYVWLAEPWRRRLPPVPTELTRGVTSAGAGVMPDVEQVPPGQMYDHLYDLALRYAQVGRILNADVVERILLVQFEAVRVPGADYGDPRTGRRDTRRIAEFAVTSDIAARERARAEFAARWRTPPQGARA